MYLTEYRWKGKCQIFEFLYALIMYYEYDNYAYN